jgi:hypothetical protein
MLYNFPEEENPQLIVVFGISVIDWLTDSENHVVCVFAAVGYS